MSSAEHSPELTFEQNLDRLEVLLEKIETGKTPLAEFISQFEQGMQWLQHCQKQLQEAELRIEQLRQDKDGWQTQAFDPEKI